MWGAILSVPLAILVDACAIEPYSVDVSTHEVKGPVTIVHLSDLHSKGFGRRERRILEVVAEVKPDLVAVTGDVVDDGKLENVRELFSQLKAPLGVFVVRGNWENWRPPPGEAS